MNGDGLDNVEYDMLENWEHEKSDLVTHARRELELAGHFDDDGLYGKMLGESVLQLIKLFSKQGHSGYSASCARSLFNKLANYKNISPLTFEDDEWEEAYGDEMYQNKRMSSVFKSGKDGRPYYIDAYYYTNQEGISYSGNLTLSSGKKIRHCYIKDQSKMPQVKFDVKDWEVNKQDESIIEPGSGWWTHIVLNEAESLQELERYYDIEYF
jgi:hypothetical protein